ncbi:MAG TPA: hypothetical protein GXX73_07095 [Clostridium sp.]|uniref:Uncharacterized protein n=2 Tax=Acetivibrio mesophilus TaxID=2487273 RepID=A0A4Q0I7J3_9FIRM|nr:hypothetical protein EFD62_09280 [Acetivibrio mesophilus]HHV29344.1 hypothetical protein [Clostridium sp.]
MKGRFFAMTENQPVKVGLKSKITNKLVAVYPHSVNVSSKEVEKQVFDWYYAQGCANEDELPNLFVDTLTDEELKNFH